MEGGQQPPSENRLAVVGMWFRGEDYPDLPAFAAGIYTGAGGWYQNLSASFEPDGLTPEDALLLAAVDESLAHGEPGPAR